MHPSYMKNRNTISLSGASFILLAVATTLLLAFGLTHHNLWLFAGFLSLGILCVGSMRSNLGSKHATQQNAAKDMPENILEKNNLERKLRESEEKFHYLFTNMMNGFALHEIICNERGEPIDYRFVTANPAFEKCTGLKVNDIIGKTVLEVLPQTEPFWIQTYGKVALSGEPIHFEHFAESLHRHYSVSAFCPGKGQFACIMEDITNHKNTINALQESHQRYEQLALHCQTFHWEVDTEGRYTYVTESVEAVTGYTAAEIYAGKYFYDLVPEAERAHLIDFFQKLLKDGGSFKGFDNRIQTKSGNIIWVESSGITICDDTGTIIGVRGHDSDNTKRKQAETRTERLAEGIEQAAEAVIITNKDAIIEYANPAFTQITGHERTEVIGKPVGILKSEVTPAETYKHMWTTLRAGNVWRGQLINQHKDGRLYTQETTISPIRNAHNEIIDYVSVMRDISDTLKLQEKLAQAQKMESIGRLASGLAHDFNNIIIGIMGSSDIAREKLPPHHPALEDLDLISDMTNRCAALTRQLLTFGSKQHAVPVTLNLRNTIEPTLKMLQRLIGESVQIQWQVDDNLWNIKIDATQMDQILMNLCINAKDALQHRNGTICMQASNTELTAKDCEQIGNLKPGKYVCCSIQDDGCGIPLDIQKKIFDPFFTTKQPGAGTGLGLATVYGIMQQNNGFIDLVSQPNKGTTIHLYFPREEEPVELPTHTQHPVQKPTSTHSNTVLLVEDEDFVRAMSKRLLKHLGFHVLDAANGQEALHLATSSDTMIDILLTDIMMPELDGHELSKRIRKTWPDIKVIFMSGYSSNLTPNLDMPANHQALILEKPFRKEDLATILNKALQTSTSR